MVKFEPLNFSPMINLSDGSYTKWREKRRQRKIWRARKFSLAIIWARPNMITICKSKQLKYCNRICVYCSSWCKIGDELYSFVSRWSHFGCWSLLMLMRSTSKLTSSLLQYCFMALECSKFINQTPLRSQILVSSNSETTYDRKVLTIDWKVQQFFFFIHAQHHTSVSISRLEMSFKGLQHLKA